MASVNSAVAEVERPEVSNKMNSETLMKAFNLINLGYCGEYQVHEEIAGCLEELGIPFVYEPSIVCRNGNILSPSLTEPSNKRGRNSTVICDGEVCSVVFPDFYLPSEKIVLEIKCKTELTYGDKKQFVTFASIPKETAIAIYCVQFNDRTGRLKGVHDITNFTSFQAPITNIYRWAKKSRAK